MPQNFTILIVEDDEDARSNMEDIISLDGHRTFTASHCLEAVNAVESRHFDAIVVDWRLPDGNGADLIPIVKRALPDSPIIVVTGVREFDAAVTALRTGAYDFLTKPINPDALRSLLNRLVERKQHLAEIESAQKRLLASERLAAVGQMVAGLAHESRNALQRSHACLAELSLDLEDMPESLALVQKIQTALDDMHGLLEEVREYSAPINLDVRSVDLKELVQNTWRQVLDAAKQQSMPELLIHDDALEATVRVDPARLQQVVRNLLENALFAAKSAIEVELKSKPITGGVEVSIAVSDDGAGVAETARQEVFAPFYTTKTKGTGLGLAISQRIAEAHGGTISIADESPLGGACFVVSLRV